MDRWLHSQLLGVTASVMLTHPGTHPAFRKARRILQSDMTSGQAEPRGFDFFRTLPPWVLTVLARAFRKSFVPKLNPFAVLAEKALQHNLVGREDDTSTIARAQIWAYHVLLSHTGADGLLRLGRTILGHYEEWLKIDSSANCLADLSQCLATIRDPIVSARDKCLAIGKLGEILGQTPFWEQIENILYHNQFCWPLLVFDSKSSRSLPHALALSLPVSVDVIFDNRGEIRESTEGDTLTPRWRAQLELAVHAAKTLWRSEHMNCGRFRDLVDAASITFDFSPAGKIVEPLAKALGAHISLSDRSAEAYFSQVVLSRLLGRGNVMVNAITGLIGDQTRDEHGIEQPNFQFEAPGGISEKMEYVAATAFFERIVLPNSQESKDATENFLKELGPSDQGKKGTSVTRFRSIELLFAEDLESVSDQVHTLGWRQRQYIRCPELEWAIHSKGSPGLLRPSEDKRVKEVMARLATNDRTLLEFKASPAVVASAFCCIDEIWGHKEPELSEPLSWAFIKVSDTKYTARWDDERDLFFWELFFKAIGLGSNQFLNFLRRPSMGEAVKYLTSYLNTLVPGPDQPPRRPDLIVLIGRQTLSKSTGRSCTLSSRPFMVDSILNELKNGLQPVGRPHDSVSRLIGKTRIIILPDAASEETIASEVPLKDLGEDELLQLRYLATLEDGFARRTAGLLLSRSGVSTGQISHHEILEKFLRKGTIRYVRGKYHVPSFVAKKIPPDKSPEDKVKRHYAAGAALAPYVIGGQGPLSMAVDVAFTPEHFEEANQQFWQALSYSRKTGSMEAGRIRQLSDEAARRLARFVMPPSWANVSRLSKGANRLPGLAALEPYEKSCELLRWYEEAHVPPHPLHLVTAAGSAVRAASCISLYVENPDVPINVRTRHEESPLQLHGKARELYLQALRDCSMLPKHEQGTTLLFCLTKYLVYLCQRHWTLIENEKQSDRESKQKEIRLIWSQIVDLLNHRVKLLTSDCLECFELMGDRETDHGKALDIYLKGMGKGLMWSHLSLKSWGAASLCGLSDRLDRMLKKFPAQQRGHLIYKAFYNSALREGKLSPHEVLRIREGMRVFESFYRNNAHVKVTKAAFDRDYGSDAIRRWVKDEGQVLRGMVTELRHDQQYGFLRSENGRQYRFQVFQLVDGLTYDEISEGMELDFQLLREAPEGGIGDAVNVRQPLRPLESPVQMGKVSVLKTEGRYGFISSGGKEYHFHTSCLGEGLSYDDIYEGMWVEFQVKRGQPQGKAEEATNVGSPRNAETVHIADLSGATASRGRVSELKRQGRYGFIVSAGREYHFHAAHLSGGLGYDEIHEGMEVDFDIIRESTDIGCGQARRICNISDERQNCMSHADSSAEGIEEARRTPRTASSAITPRDRLRGKVSLFKQDGKYGFLSSAGTDYYFTAADLRGGLNKKNVYEGMAVDFTVLSEETPRASARATDILLMADIDVWKTAVRPSFIAGTISFVKSGNNYGFIRSSPGQDYYFSGSDLREGLVFTSLCHGMAVEFQVRNAGKGDQAPEAMNVRPAPRSPAQKVQLDYEPPQSVSSRGSISFIKHGGDYGFIRSVNGRDYQFHESDLAEDMVYKDLCLGMEIEFQIFREGKHGKAGKAIHVCPANDSSGEALPTQRGVVYCLVPKLRCGFISLENSKEYQFTDSDLTDGLKYEDIRECAEVTFHIRKEPDKKAGKAMNVRLAKK